MTDKERKSANGLSSMCKGILAQSNTYGEYSSQYKKNNFMLNAGHQNYFVFVFLLSKPTLTKQKYSIYALVPGNLFITTSLILDLSSHSHGKFAT